MPKYLISLLFCAIISSKLIGQNSVTIQIKDAKFDNPLAFVFLSDSSNSKGGQTDINGFIQLQLKQGDCIHIQLYGYKSQKQIWHGQNPWTIHLESDNLILSELVIKIKEDPAVKVIKRCIQNATFNNPVENLDYQFEQYSKMIVDFERKGDSSFFKTFANKRLLLSETIALHQHKAPSTNKETIIANQMSGFEFPQSTIIGSQMQSFSAYEPDFQILDRVLISPLGPRAMDRYDYTMLDTITENTDSVFVIQYIPKKRFQGNGLIGVAHIKTPEYALTQLTAEPFEKESSYYIKIQQKIEKKGGAFFPIEMNSFYKLTQSTPEIFGEIQTHFKNIEIRKFESKDFDAVVFDFPSSANTVTDGQWEKFRYYPLSVEEKNTYSFMDSLGKAQHLDMRVNRLQSLLEGQWMLGKINMDLFQLYRYNQFEGSRLGVALSTNSLVHKRWKWDGHMAYGFNDHQPKFGTGLSWTSPNDGINFRLGYTDEVQESGRNGMVIYRRNINQQVYDFFITKMDYVKGVTLDVQMPLVKNIKLLYAQSHLVKTPDISFTDNKPQPYNITLNRFTLRWTPGEKKRRVIDQEVILSGYWPIIQFSIGQGIIDKNSSFIRHQIGLEKTFHSVYFGDVRVNVECGKTMGVTPMNELNALRGSRLPDARINIAVPETFETVLNNQWYARSYAHYFIRYKWKTPFYSHSVSSPKMMITFNGGWGNLNEHDPKINNIRDYPKGIFETGLSLNDILISKTGGIGLGCFTRLGVYSATSPLQNLVLKITSNFLF